MDKLRIIGGDGCAVNTGPKNGVFALFEKEAGKALQHFICCLHITELPLRHLVRFYIGDTASPSGFKGELGSQLVSLDKPEIAEFPPIPNPDFPEIDDATLKGMSRDQSLMYRACKAVMSGTCPTSVSESALGGVSQ